MSDVQIRKFTIGKPLNTGAVVMEGLASEDFKADEKGCFPIKTVFDESLCVNVKAKEISFNMAKDLYVFGLGETIRGINKRGWQYFSNNSDEPHHEEAKRSLYAAHNFLIPDDGEKCFGLFIVFFF